MTSQRQWWHSSTIYQIYPRSFCDSGSKGHGDIKGITSRLDYLKQLGIGTVWLCPIYRSPQIDNGYDISDYYQIEPAYGTMADFDELLRRCHSLGLRLIMDIVINHTSTEHPWFQKALKEPDSPERDFYIWQEGIDGKPPTNWQSKFGGSAWQYDEASKQYYLHLFAKEQADLNWENPKLREQVCDVMRFWAKKGVDGFRLDVINLISKDQRFPQETESGPQQDGRRFYTDGPRVHEFLQEANREVFTPFKLMTVGEMSSTTLEQCQRYSDPDSHELSMVFNFHHLKVDYPGGDKWQLAQCDLISLKAIFAHWQQGLHNVGWNALFWCNHDQPRIVSRFGCDGPHRVFSAKMLGTALHMMQGTPFIYQGEEIGMTNPKFKHLEQYQDVETHNIYRLKQSQGTCHQDLMAVIGDRSRDNSRTPMQWDETPNAGFTRGTPWLDVAENFPEINVKRALEDPDSVFYHYQKLIQLRRDYPIITEGDYQDLCPEDPKSWCYLRQYQEQKLLVINNFSANPIDWQLPQSLPQTGWQLVCANYPGSPEPSSAMTLRPYESLVFLNNGEK
ncbi:alpha,alpha-phosphotrehalase [Dongshaea marina]|uniref:alpha,alpha-phosphotrehalase n=1 Tax=Dongshaea marina TaxID=2047966 RepID=UPI000D3ECBCC|nr:alpha,alpha-phosphotrehalase [Dongshaea marina]